MKDTLKTKTEPIIRFFKKQKLFSSFILCLIIFLIYFAVSGYNIISGNDDYCIFKMIYYGDTAVPCVGWFFSSFISFIQPLFGKLNSYMIIQELICLSSLTAINYVFLSSLRNKTALLSAVAFDVIYCSFIPLNIMFSYTAVVGCTAGMTLLIFASMFEKRKCFRITQEIIALLIMLAASQVRFPPIKALTAVVFVFALGVLTASFFRNKKENSIKKAVIISLKKYLKTGVLIVIAIIIAFSADYASSALKYTVKGYDEIEEYNNTLSSIVDYDTSSYDDQVDFYKSLGIKSVSDISLLKHWFIDEDFFTINKLHAIKEHDEANGTLSLQSGIIEGTLEPISKVFDDLTESGFIIILVLIIVVAIITFILFIVLFPSKIDVILKTGSFVLLWSFFFIVARGFTIVSLPALSLAVLTLYISVKYDNFKYIIALFITLIVMAMYFYMVTMRMILHVSVAMFFPAFVLLVLSLGGDNAKKEDEKLKHTSVPICIIAAALIICSIITGVFMYLDQVYVQNPDDNPTLRQYIEDNPEKIFLVNQICMSKDYYNPIVMDEEPQNIMNYGLWVGKSGYMKSTRERNGVKHVYQDSVNSNIVIPILEIRDKNGAVIDKYSLDLEQYYNDHYAKKGEKIEIKKTETVGGYALYSIVSKKSKNE